MIYCGKLELCYYIYTAYFSYVKHIDNYIIFYYVYKSYFVWNTTIE